MPTTRSLSAPPEGVASSVIDDHRLPCYYSQNPDPRTYVDRRAQFANKKLLALFIVARNRLRNILLSH